LEVEDGAAGKVEDGTALGQVTVPSATYRLGKGLDGFLEEEVAGGYMALHGWQDITHHIFGGASGATGIPIVITTIL